MKQTIIIKCPYCAVTQRTTVKISPHNSKEVILCPVEDGGCDRWFVLSFWSEIKHEAMRIVEEQ